MFVKPYSSMLSPSLSKATQGLSLKHLIVLMLGGLFVVLGISVWGLHAQHHQQSVTQATALVLDELVVLNQSYTRDTQLGADAAMQRVDDLLHALRHGGSTTKGYIPALAPQFEQMLEQLETDWSSRKQYVVALDLNLPQEHLQAQSLLNVHSAFQLMLSYMQAQDQLEHRHQLWVLGLLLLNGIALLGAYFFFRHYALLPLLSLVRQAGAGLEPFTQAENSESTHGLFEYGVLARALHQGNQRIQRLLGQLHDQQHELGQLQRTYKQLSTNPLVGVYIASDNKFTFINRKLAQSLGYKRGHIKNKLLVSEVFLEPRFPSLSTVIKGGHTTHAGSKRYETRALCADGSHIDVEICQQAMNVDGVLSTFALVQDISHRVRSEVNSRLAAVVYNNTSEAIVVTDRYGVIVDANPAFSQISGYSLEEVRGSPLSRLGSDRQGDNFYKMLWLQVMESGRWQGDIWSKRKNGSEFAERLTISTAWNPDGTVYRFIGLFTDLTSHKEREVQMWKQAHHDHLTGLPNRQMFQYRLKQAMDKSRHNGLAFALIFMDLDYFKDVNDTLGHKEGDALLQEVAMRLQGCVRDSDTVARIGGDEFTVIVADITNEKVVDRICQDMLKCVSRPFVLGNNTATVSASLGVTFYPEDGKDAGELLKNADMAMYAAKACGRNQYCRFLPAMGEAVQARMRFSQDLQTAIEEQQFCLYYQPVLDLKTGRVSKAEALIRWDHPQLGLVPPSEFIPFSEDSGLIVAIGEWVLKSAALQAAYLRKYLDPHFQISINVSAAQLKLDTSCVDDWIAFLQEEGIEGEALIVEITERLLLDNQEQTMAQLRKLRHHNIGVALDDFGTGYSSLSYLKRFAISLLKIDQCYIRNLATCPEDMALIQAMVAMAHTLGLGVVAEGVDKPEQVTLLRQIGCDMLQGFWCSPPVPAQEFEAWCKEWNDNEAARWAEVLERAALFTRP